MIQSTFKKSLTYKAIYIPIELLSTHSIHFTTLISRMNLFVCCKQFAE